MLHRIIALLGVVQGFLARTFTVGPVARLILDARVAMNHGGAHWIKGSMCDLVESLTDEDRADGEYNLLGLRAVLKRDPRKCGFCAVGGMRFAAFGDYEPKFDADNAENLRRYKLGIGVLATSPAVATFYAESPQADSYASWAGRAPEYRGYGDNESYVIGWNDDPGTRWDEVNDGFILAASKATSSPFVKLALRTRVLVTRASRRRPHVSLPSFSRA